MVSGAHTARYRKVSCTFIRATDKAVCICQERAGCSENFWVPRVFLHGADDNMITRDLEQKRLYTGDPLELRIEQWICERDEIEGLEYSVYDRR